MAAFALGLWAPQSEAAARAMLAAPPGPRNARDGRGATTDRAPVSIPLESAYASHLGRRTAPRADRLAPMAPARRRARARAGCARRRAASRRLSAARRRHAVQCAAGRALPEARHRSHRAARGRRFRAVRAGRAAADRAHPAAPHRTQARRRRRESPAPGDRDQYRCGVRAQRPRWRFQPGAHRTLPAADPGQHGDADRGADQGRPRRRSRRRAGGLARAPARAGRRSSRSTRNPRSRSRRCRPGSVPATPRCWSARRASASRPSPTPCSAKRVRPPPRCARTTAAVATPRRIAR